jgi:transcriptional repressor NrdR
MVHACQKTGLAHDILERIVDEIEAQLQSRSRREVTTAEIGDLVLEQLKPLSEVAYVRFASVYQQFQGVSDFMTTLSQFQKADPSGAINAGGINLSNPSTLRP